MRRGVRRGRRRRELGRRRRHRRPKALGRHRGALRHPRDHRRDADPERRRLRPGGQPDDRPRAHLGPQAARHADLRRRRLRLRLPHQPLQARSRPLRRARGDLPVQAGRPRLPGAVRRAGRRPRRRDRRAGAGADVREAVLALRRRKGMVLDPKDHDTWSTGSFFTNPVGPADVVPEGAPAWPQPDGLVKTSAAWLIEHAGFTKGYGNDRVRLSYRHTLALTNRGRPAPPRCWSWLARCATGCGAVRDHAGQRARAGGLRALVALDGAAGGRGRVRDGDDHDEPDHGRSPGSGRSCR